MLKLTRLPKSVSNFLQVAPVCFKYRHGLILGWVLVLHLIYSGKADLKSLSRIAPNPIGYERLRRLLAAGYWCTKVLIGWFAKAALEAFPPPFDRVCYLVGDSTLKGKRSKKNPAVFKTRLSQHHAYVMGIKIVLLMVAWDVYRIPVDFEIVLPKTHPDYKKENDLFLEMFWRFQPPGWAIYTVVVADCAFASKKNLNAIKRRKGFFFVMALARTWKFEDGSHLKDLVNHICRRHFHKIWLSRPNSTRRRTYFVYAKSACLHVVGNVTVVLSKLRHNDGPKNTKILVTNLPNVDARQIVAIYQRRWSVELLIKELKGVTGLGQHQVTKDVGRVQRSIAISFMAYLMLLKLRASDIQPGHPWSAFALKRNFAWEVMQHQAEISATRTARKWLQERQAA